MRGKEREGRRKGRERCGRGGEEKGLPVLSEILNTPLIARSLRQLSYLYG